MNVVIVKKKGVKMVNDIRSIFTG